MGRLGMDGLGMDGLREDTRNRVIFALAGTLAGFAFWVATELLDASSETDRLPALFFVAVTSFSTAFLMLSGPISFLRAAMYSAGSALVITLLFLWASFRFESIQDFSDSFHPIMACIILVFLPLPFYVAREIAPGGFRDYEVLFDEAWAIAIRWVVAHIFCGAFWLVYFLCSELLDLVGLDFLSDLADEEWFVFSLSGLALGLAISVLVERHAVVTTLRSVVQQLLRLLLPAIAAVVLIFIVALPVQGLERLFGLLSAAMTVLAMAMGSIKLITASIDNKDDQAARNPVLVWTSRLLAVLLPVLPGIALYAIWLRVDQYGWSPLRITALTLGILIGIYAVLYAATQLKRDAWRQAVRTVNTWMALVVIGLSVLWLTPLFHLERVSANDQVARFIDGETTLEDLELGLIWHDWGNAGQEAVDRLRALEDHPEQEALQRMLAAIENSEDLWDIRDTLDTELDTQKLEEVLQTLPILPQGAEFPVGLGESMSSYLIDSLATSCAMSLPDGRPACVLVVSQTGPDDPREQAFLFFLEYGDVQDLGAYGYLPDPINADRFLEIYRIQSIGPDLEQQDPQAIIARVLDGAFSITPVRRYGIDFGETQVFTSN